MSQPCGLRVHHGSSTNTAKQQNVNLSCHNGTGLKTKEAIFVTLKGRHRKTSVGRIRVSCVNFLMFPLVKI